VRLADFVGVFPTDFPDDLQALVHRLRRAFIRDNRQPSHIKIPAEFAHEAEENAQEQQSVKWCADSGTGERSRFSWGFTDLLTFRSFWVISSTFGGRVATGTAPGQLCTSTNSSLSQFHPTRNNSTSFSLWPSRMRRR
jgi:hypothetical protein